MSEYIISTELTTDLPLDYFEKENILVNGLIYTLNGKTYKDGEGLSSHDFFEALRNGADVTTSQINPESAAAVLRTALEDGKDILHIAFSSGLSGTCQSFCIAAEELREEFPERKIEIVDSFAGSFGEGMLVYYANEKKKQGNDLYEVKKWVEENRLKISHDFTVDDLMYLARGGRISKGAAVAGSIIGIKPILHMDDEGKLVPIGKERGRKKSLISIARRCVENLKGNNTEEKVVMICHGDCIDDANFVKEKVKSLLGEEADSVEFIINDIDAVIGSHAGPGTVGIFSYGIGRNI